MWGCGVNGTDTSDATNGAALPGTVPASEADTAVMTRAEWQKRNSPEYLLGVALQDKAYLEERLRLQEHVSSGVLALDTLHKGEADRARQRLAAVEQELALVYAALAAGEHGEAGKEIAQLKVEALKRFLERPPTLEEHNKYPNGRFRS